MAASPETPAEPQPELNAINGTPQPHDPWLDRLYLDEPLSSIGQDIDASTWGTKEDLPKTG